MSYKPMIIMSIIIYGTLNTVLKNVLKTVLLKSPQEHFILCSASRACLYHCEMHAKSSIMARFVLIHT